VTESSVIGDGITVRGWLSLDPAYEGEGRLVFANPDGVVKGWATAKVGDTGRLSIELEMAEVEADDADMKGYSAEIQLEYLLTGQKPKKIEGGILRTYGGAGDGTPRYGDLVMTTADGVLTAPSSMYKGHTWSLGGSGGAPVVRLRPTIAQFDAAGASAAKYWVFPLANFVGQCGTKSPRLYSHRLRVWPLPDLSVEDPTRAILLEHAQHRLICFELDGIPGFIEHLLDYDERKQRLEAGTARNLVTSVMVGEVGANDIDALDGWLPFGFLRLLGLASGNEVGAPWFEFRDDQGELVRRVHKDLGRPSFVAGRVAIAEERVEDPETDGIGYLLTKAAQCVEFVNDTSRLNVNIRQLLRTGLSDRTIEERIVRLFGVLDGLLEYTGVATIDLTLELDSTLKAQVDQIRDAAAAQVNALARAARASGNNDDYNTLGKIENKLRAATRQDQKFRLALAALLDKYQLLDAQVADEYFAQQARPGLDNWAGALSYYRGIPVHEGYFDTVQKGHDIEEAIQVMNHLRDVLVRITLRMLGYDGKYQPVMKIGPIGLCLDWVTAKTTAAELGYK
jgi:hypothetical protein